MNVLGINDGYDSHDTSAAIVCDGDLIAAAEEERFSRSKHETRFPLSAIDYCLQQAGLRMDQVDALAFPHQPFRSGPDSSLADMHRSILWQQWKERQVRLRTLVHKELLSACLRAGIRLNIGDRSRMSHRLQHLREHYHALPRIRFYDHHHAHAAAAYFTSGYKSAAVITLDWSGGPYATVAWKAAEKRIERLRAELKTNSLGRYYSDCTYFLGLSDLQTGFMEGKTMGLAAYGKRDDAPEVSPLLSLSGCEWYRYVQQPTALLLGFPRGAPDSVLETRYRNFAAAIQHGLEQALQRIVQWTIAEAGTRSVCLGGGVALNCSANGALRDSGITESMSVFPGSNDAGLSVGAAFLCAAEAGERPRGPLNTAYLGPEHVAETCEAALRQEPALTYHKPANLTDEVARCIAAGKIIGWFQGRMEFGPRALGNRSILADPRSTAIRDRVNRLKGRESWRPLAPVVIADRASEYFESTTSSPFMLFRTFVKQDQRQRIAGIVHVDGSARPQTLTVGQNPLLYELLLAFERHAGVPVLLNTSFNAAGEPLVCTPADAVRTFLKTRLDVLVLGGFLATPRRVEMQPQQSAAEFVYGG
jgi:carbamoyltransferase